MSSNIEKEPGPQGDSPEQTPSTPEPEKKKREYKDFGHDEEKPTRA
jgi:H+-transporting ATPase